MGEDIMAQGETQADFIKNELNFSINPDDFTKATADDPVDEWMDILGNNQLRKKVIHKGKDGTRPKKFNICVINAIGTLTNGTVVERMNNFTIVLGDMDVIQGLDLAITLMDVGETAEIVIDPRFAYGKHGNEPMIPPNAVITYKVELKEAKTQPPITTYSLDTRRKIGIKKRERGNSWFFREEYHFAILCYERALICLGEEFYSDNSEIENDVNNSIDNTLLQNMLEDSVKVYNNLAAALIKIENYDKALINVEKALKHQPQNDKALYRKGRILKLKGEYTKAYITFSEVLKINPNMTIIHTELAKLKDKIAKGTKKEKRLYRKMLGMSIKDSSINLSEKTQDKNKIAKGLLWTLVGGASAAIIGILIHRFVS